MVENNKAKSKEYIFKILIGLLFGLGIFDVLYSFTGAYAPFGLLYPEITILFKLLFYSLFLWRIPSSNYFKINFDQNNFSILPAILFFKQNFNS